jgi:hypothetical protein
MSFSHQLIKIMSMKETISRLFYFIKRRTKISNKNEFDCILI